MTNLITDNVYDSVNWPAIPADARMVMGYCNGGYEWPEEAWARFPTAIKVIIAVELDQLGTWRKANMYDVENGALTIAQAKIAIQARQRIGKRGNILYCSRSNLDAAREGLRGLAYWTCIADWTGEPHQVPGCDMTQYENNGGLWDRSACYSRELMTELDEVNRPWPL